MRSAQRHSASAAAPTVRPRRKATASRWVRSSYTPVPVETPATTAQANFDTAHPLYVQIAGLAKLRRATPALTGGSTRVRAFSDKLTRQQLTEEELAAEAAPELDLPAPGQLHVGETGVGLKLLKNAQIDGVEVHDAVKRAIDGSLC